MNNSKTQGKEDFFEIFFENIPISLIITNNKGEIIYLNKLTEDLFSYEKAELINKNIEILIPKEVKKDHSKYHKSYIADPTARPMGKGRDLYAVKNNGQEFPVEIGLSPIKHNNNDFVIASIVDITSRKEAEELIKENESKLQSLLDNSPDSIIVYTTDGKIIQTNRECEEKYIRDRKINNIRELIPSKYEKTFYSKLEDARNGEKIIDWENERILSNNKKICVSSSIIYTDIYNGIFIETLRDITDRINLRGKIVEYEKAQLFAKVSEGIAHHMGTPLSSMLLRIQMLKEDLKNYEIPIEQINKLDLIEKQILYGKKIMQKLLNFSNDSVGEKRVINPLDTINNALDVLSPLIKKKNIEVKKDNLEDCFIFVDPDMFELVISDIFMNSIDAIYEDNGIIEVSNSVDENKNTLRIRDTGIGIPKQILANVFEPFYTTKPAGKGTGLGLAVAKRVLEEYDGEIDIKSTENMETVVTITIPISGK